MENLEKKFIALDLELNQPSAQIIQVGVALGSPSQKEDEYIVASWLIKPPEALDPFITQLTGITEEDLQLRAVPWEVVARELSSLITEHQPFVNPVTWGGGDSVELLDGFRQNGVEFKHFGRRWVDVKTYHVFSSLAQGKNPSGGLRSIMSRYGTTFKGEPHRADVDAFNTLRLFFKLLQRQRGLEEILNLAKSA